MQQTIQKQTHKPKQKNAWKYILSVIIILIYILPIYVLVNMAFKHPTDLGSRLLPPTYFDISNFTSIIESGKLFRALGNTVLIAVGTVAIEVVFGCMAAYAFARNRSRLNSFMQSFCLGIMMIPPLSILLRTCATRICALTFTASRLLTLQPDNKLYYNPRHYATN